MTDTNTELAYASISDIAPRVASGEVSPVEVTRACLDRIGRLDAHVNAFITVLADSALDAARRAESEIGQGQYRGPLHGIPIALKDLYYTAGTAGLNSGVRGLRVGIPRSYFSAGLQPDVEHAWRDAIEVLVGLGGAPVEVEFTHLEDAMEMGMTIVRAEMSTFHQDWYAQRPADYSAPIRERFESIKGLSAIEYIQAQRSREHIRADLWSALDHADVLVTPTMPTTATRIGSDSVEPSGAPPEAPATPAFSTRFTYPFNLSGFPALSVPCGFDRLGLPIGLQLAARPWHESLLLRVGHTYQTATDWHRRRAPDPV